MWVLWIAGGLLAWAVVAALLGLALGKVIGQDGEAEHHGPAGWRRATELRPRRGTGPCDRRHLRDSPGPSALAFSGLPAVSAAVRGGPGRVLRAVSGSHLPAEVPPQTGDETADPGSGLVQQRHVCVSPPRSVVWDGPRPTHRPKLSTREWQLMVVFLLTVFTAVVLLAAGFLLGVFWLRDERTRLTALREDITQESATMQRLGHDRDADFTARGESPPTGRHHQVG